MTDLHGRSYERELRVAVFGATGLAGTGVVQAWLGDPRVREMRAVTRRPLAASDPRLQELRCDDFLELEPIAASLAGLDAVCFCLGISASQASSRDEYRRITHGFAFAAGRAVRSASPEAIFHFIASAAKLGQRMEGFEVGVGLSKPSTGPVLDR